MTAFRDKTRKDIIAIAHKMLNGGISFIEGSRLISNVRFSAELDEDPDVRVLLGIDSETDALPIGEFQQHWSEEALARKQEEIDQAEKWAREVGTKSCQNLIIRLSSELERLNDGLKELDVVRIKRSLPDGLASGTTGTIVHVNSAEPPGSFVVEFMDGQKTVGIYDVEGTDLELVIKGTSSESRN
jgi:hypothetical protein